MNNHIGGSSNRTMCEPILGDFEPNIGKSHKISKFQFSGFSVFLSFHEFSNVQCHLTLHGSNFIFFVLHDKKIPKFLPLNRHKTNRVARQFRISPHRRNAILGIENWVQKGCFRNAPFSIAN